MAQIHQDLQVDPVVLVVEFQMLLELLVKIVDHFIIFLVVVVELDKIHLHL